jgi:hypothetical protein
MLMHSREPDKSGAPRYAGSGIRRNRALLDSWTRNPQTGPLLYLPSISNIAVRSFAEIWLSSHSRRELISVSVTVCYSVSVKTTEILAALDAEIARLQETRNALAGLSGAKRRGRPSASASPSQTTNKKRVLSAAAREKIAAAQRKRWAKQKKSS